MQTQLCPLSLGDGVIGTEGNSRLGVAGKVKAGEAEDLGRRVFTLAQNTQQQGASAE